MKRLFSSTLPFLFTLAGAATAFGLEPIAVLKPSDVPAQFSNWFGFSVDMSGDYLAVGAPHDPWFNGNATGAVYVLRRVGPRWVEQDKLLPSVPVWQGFMGRAVAIDGDVVVAGAPDVDFASPCGNASEGYVYVFRRDDHGTPDDPSDDTWQEEARLTAPVRQGRIEFGTALGVSGGVIVASSACEENVEVFRHIDGVWTHETTLAGPPPDEWEWFGWSLDIEGNRIVVGAPGYAGVDDERGAVYVFDYFDGAWVREAKLTAPESRPRDALGRAVAVTGDNVIGGAPFVDGVGLNSSSGAAYAFQRDGTGQWAFQSELTGSSAVYHAQYGSAIACDAGACLVAKNTYEDPSADIFCLTNAEWLMSDALFGVDYATDACVEGNYAVLSFVNPRVYVVRNRKSTSDFASFQRCFGHTDPECVPFDLAADGVVDLHDFVDFLATFGGP